MNKIINCGFNWTINKILDKLAILIGNGIDNNTKGIYEVILITVVLWIKYLIHNQISQNIKF